MHYIRDFLFLLVLLGITSANMQHGGQQQVQQQQHQHPAYIIPTVNRQSGLGGLASLGSLGSFGGFGGLSGLSGLSSLGGLSGLSGLGGGGSSGGGGGGGLSSILSSLGGMSGSSMLSTALPLLMVVGLGAMLVPLLGGAFFRESQKRGLPSISPAFLDGVTDIMEKFIKALDAVEKKY